MKKLLALFPVAALVLSACSEGPTSPSSGALFHHKGDHEVGGGAQVCPNDDPTGSDMFQWTKIDSGSGNESGPWGSFDYSGTTLDYVVNSGWILHLCVKSGAQVGTESHEIPGPASGQIVIAQDISHVSWKVEQVNGGENGGEWCSPGFWRNNPGRVAETGVDMTETYSDVFGEAPERSRQGVRQGAPEDPTLQEVLDNPQWYGGEAFNNVADHLSEEHEDVDFQGERVEDSCPLSADQANSG